MKEDEAPESLRRVARPSAVNMDDSSYFDEDNDTSDDAADNPAPSSTASDGGEGRSRGRGKRGGRGQKKSNESDPLRVIDLDADEVQSDDKPFQYNGTEKGKFDDDGGQRGRRGQRGGRKRNERTERGKLGNREMAEAAATSMLSGRDALDDAILDLFLPPTFKPQPIASETEEKPEKPARKPRSRSKKKADPAPVEESPTVVDEVVVDKTVVEQPVVESETPLAPQETATPAPVETAPEATPEPAAKTEKPSEPDPLSVNAPPTPPRSEPKKRGWWSRKPAS